MFVGEGELSEMGDDKSSFAPTGNGGDAPMTQDELEEYLVMLEG